jgi:hypothetical protein
VAKLVRPDVLVERFAAQELPAQRGHRLVLHAAGPNGSTVICPYLSNGYGAKSVE